VLGSEGVGAMRTPFLAAGSVALIATLTSACARTDAPGAQASAASGLAGECHVVHGWPALQGELLGVTSGVGVDSRGNVHVLHRAGRNWYEDRPFPADPIARSTIMVFDGASGALLRRWGEGVFIMPHGLTVDSQDNVWVTDVGLHQVFQFSPEGQLLLTVGARAHPGSTSGSFNQPTDVAVRPDGGFYVSDGYENTRIVRFDPDGRFVASWGAPGNGPGEFDLPHGIELDGSGRLYVADRSNARVQIFDSAGTFLTEWRGPRIGRPAGLALAPDGSVFVADIGDLEEEPLQVATNPARRRGVVRLSAEGEVLGRFGAFGIQDGQFITPHDVAVAPDGSVYIVDADGWRVQKFVCQWLDRRAGP
jgi:peptidylamidoglycolate lyase